MDGVKGDWIDGVKIVPMGKILDERGCIYKITSEKDEHFILPKEVYVSTINPEAIKGWHKHKNMNLFYSCIVGNIKLVLYDDRKDSDTKGNIMEIFIGEEAPMSVVIPPMIWNGFKSIGGKKSMIINCASLTHNPEEQERLPPNTDKIPYDWGIKHE